MPEPKTYTEEEMRRIVEFTGAVERLRERAISSTILATQRARAAGDSKESIATLEWISGGVELLIADYIRKSTTPPEKPAEQSDEPQDDDQPDE
jgi:hypothetical protein